MSPLLPALLLLALALPAPGTGERGRDFCRDWLAASPLERDAALAASEARDLARDEDTRRCAERLRPRARRALDGECRNWSALMDFEVRQVLDAARAPCHGD